jgi:hypothetical protein
MPFIWDWFVDRETGCLGISPQFILGYDLLTKLGHVLSPKLLSKIEDTNAQETIPEKGGRAEDNGECPGNALG